MRVMGLDLSTRTGFSVMEPFALITSGLIVSKSEGDHTAPNYPYNYLQMAWTLAKRVKALVEELKPDVIVIEETNKGKNRYSQKQLEFIHFAVAEALEGHVLSKQVEIVYIDTGRWRKLLQVDYDKEDRLHNREHSNQRSDFRKNLDEEVRSIFNPEMQEEIDAIDSKRDRKKLAKAYEELLSDIVKEACGKFRVRIDGKVAGRVSKKDLSVELVDSLFPNQFKSRDHDICDSVCLCLGYYESIGVSNKWRTTIRTRS